MPHLLNRMPFPGRPEEVFVRNERVRIRADQIIVWVSLARRQDKVPHPAAVAFPAVLDTGYNHLIGVNERHLTEWAGLRPDVLALVGRARDRGQRVQLRAANVWVHPNVPGSRGRSLDQPPHPVKIDPGISVYPGGDFPRLPILGLRAVAENDLMLTVDGRRRAATLRTPARWWPG
jgi:hypothetical protein